MFTNLNQRSRLDDIAIFVCVVQSGSFTAAADQLQTSKSVISKNISRLENQLGVKLLIRSTRRLQLTEIGQVFYNKSVKGLETLQTAEEEVSILQGSPRGVLRINAPHSFGIMHIAPNLTALKALHPELSINLNMDDKKVDMIKDDFDLTIRITQQLDGNLIAKKMAPCKHVIVSAPEYIQKNGFPKSPEALIHHNIITYQYQQSPNEWALKSAKGSKTISIESQTQMNNSLAIREAVLSGLGIARMPTFVVGKDIKDGRLIRLLPEYELLELSIYIMYPDRQFLAPKVRAFIDFFSTLYQVSPPWDCF